MRPGEIKNLPLAVLKDIHQLLGTFEELYKSNSDIITRSEESDGLVLLFNSNENEKFKFYISNARLDINGQKVVYTCSYTPSNETNFEGLSGHADLQTIVNWFQKWVTLLRELNKYQTLLSEPFLKEYTDEFFAEFEFIEEDDDTRPYETQKQIALYNALVILEEKLKVQEQNGVIQEIIKDTIDLKNNIQNISKGATKKRVAKLFAKIKKGGIQLFKDVVEVGYKEIIKAALNYGANNIGHFL